VKVRADQDGQKVGNWTERANIRTYNFKIGIAKEFLVVLIGMRAVYITASFTGENHLENFFLHRIGEL
jgi:hypothetical protein